MDSIKFFFICSCLIFVFSGINFSLSPFTNLKRRGLDASYANLNCKEKYDNFEETKKTSYFTMSLKRYEEGLYNIRYCRYAVGTYTLEGISFNLNIIFGFVCVLIGIFGFQDNKIPKGNIIGMICGIIGFLSTLAYVIVGGILFTQYYPIESVYKRDGDGAFAEYEDMKGFRCKYFSGVGNKRAFIAKFSDYVKSQYNYNKKLRDFFEAQENQNCISRQYDIEYCARQEYIRISESARKYYDNCTKLYYNDGINSQDSEELNLLYDICAKFLTVLILNIFMLPIYCGLIFFAFTLPKDSSSYTQI